MSQLGSYFLVLIYKIRYRCFLGIVSFLNTLITVFDIFKLPSFISILFISAI